MHPLTALFAQLCAMYIVVEVMLGMVKMLPFFGNKKTLTFTLTPILWKQAKKQPKRLWIGILIGAFVVYVLMSPSV